MSKKDIVVTVVATMALIFAYNNFSFIRSIIGEPANTDPNATNS